MLFPSIFAIGVGSLMIGWWTISYATHQIPELESQPIAIRFHLAGEFATAGSLIIAGFGLLTGQSWGVWLYMVALGMLLYTLIVSPGYMLQRGQWPTAAMFALLFILSLISVALVIQAVVIQAVVFQALVFWAESTSILPALIFGFTAHKSPD